MRRGKLAGLLIVLSGNIACTAEQREVFARLVDGEASSCSTCDPCKQDVRRFEKEWQDLIESDGSTFRPTSTFAWLPPASRWIIMISGVISRPGQPLMAGAFGGSCDPKTSRYERLPPQHPTGTSGPIDPNLFQSPKG